MKVQIKKITTIVPLLLFLLGCNSAFARDQQETDRIEYLISSVEALQGATFIRNGAEHDARSAAEHLRLKLRNAGDRVKTAEDFIKYCGSKSSLSGKPYKIRFNDGTLIKTEAFFRDKLRTFREVRPGSKP